MYEISWSGTIARQRVRESQRQPPPALPKPNWTFTTRTLVNVLATVPDASQGELAAMTGFSISVINGALYALINQKIVGRRLTGDDAPRAGRGQRYFLMITESIRE